MSIERFHFGYACSLVEAQRALGHRAVHEGKSVVGAATPH
jgi:hypothetical protein